MDHNIIQSCYLPLHPSCLVSLLFLQHLCAPGFDKEKPGELMIQVQKCIIHSVLTLRPGDPLGPGSPEAPGGPCNVKKKVTIIMIAKVEDI